jgi:hypothetical protein
MAMDRDAADIEARVRALAEQKGYQLRHADGNGELWHLVNPRIDGKTYAFSFTKPHSFTLEEIEQILNRRPDRDDRG